VLNPRIFLVIVAIRVFAGWRRLMPVDGLVFVIDSSFFFGHNLCKCVKFVSKADHQTEAMSAGYGLYFRGFY